MKTKQLKTMVLGVMVVSMLSLFGGVASAQTDADTPAVVQRGEQRGPRDNGRNFLQQIIEELGLDTDEVRAQLADGATVGEILEASGNSVDAVIGTVITEATERLSALVTEGTITQAQMDERLANMETRLGELMTRTFDGSNRPDRPNRDNSPRGARQLVQIVAEATGLEATDIVAQVRDGATLAEVIEANGGSVEAVSNTALSAVTERVNERLANGEIDEEQAAQFLERAATMIENALNGTRPQRGNA